MKPFDLPGEIVKAINAFERATGVLSSDSRDYSKLRVAPWDAARAALAATILARLTAVESARDEAVGEREHFRDRLIAGFSQLMLAEGSAAKHRTDLAAALARADRAEKALREIAQQDRGGLQGLQEDGCSEDDAVAYLISQIERRRKIARAALAHPATAEET